MSNNRSYNPTIEAQAKLFPHLDFSDASGSRATMNAINEAAAAGGAERLTDDRVEEIDRNIPGPDGAPEVPIRIYTPKDRKKAGPGFVYFHGGGFIFGDLESDRPACLMMAAEGGAVLVSVDYRLAPEHRFPAGVEDCYAALMWVAENAQALKVDPNQISIGGRSVGGNLAAAVALMTRDRGGPVVAFQMLWYPVLDDRCETTSMKNGAGLYIIDDQIVIDCWDQYLGKECGNVSPYASPARADDLSDLPPAYVLTCEHDPLRDEGIIYALRLMAAGVSVELHNYPGTVHGFDYLTPSEISTLAIKEGIEVFRRAMT